MAEGSLTLADRGAERSCRPCRQENHVQRRTVLLLAFMAACGDDDNHPIDAGLIVDAPISVVDARIVDAPASAADGRTADAPVATADAPSATADAPISTADAPVSTPDGATGGGTCFPECYTSA